MSTQAFTCHSDFCAAHGAEIAALDAARDAEHSRAEAIKSTATDAHWHDHNAAIKRHKAELLRRRTTFQRHVAAELAPVVCTYVDEATRPSVIALRAVWAALNAESERVCGVALTLELAYALAAELCGRIPGSVRRFASPSAYQDTRIAFTPGDYSNPTNVAWAAEAANISLRRDNDVAGWHSALLVLEREVSAVGHGKGAVGAWASNDHAIEAFDLLRFSGDGSDREQALQDHHRKCTHRQHAPLKAEPSPSSPSLVERATGAIDRAKAAIAAAVEQPAQPQSSPAKQRATQNQDELVAQRRIDGGASLGV